MIICGCVIAFFTTILTGPAGREYLERRRARRDWPRAQVTYLPSGHLHAGA